MKKIILLILFLNLSCATAWTDTFEVGPVYSGDVGHIAVLVEVPKGITPKTADFQLQLNRQPVSLAKYLEPFIETDKDMALVLCVDVRGPVKEQTIRQMREALVFLIGMAGSRPADKMALVAFSDDNNVTSSFDKPREHLFDAIQSLQPGGAKTDVYQALDSALDLFNNQNLPKRRRIIVISNGNDVGSVETIGRITSKSKRMKAPIDVLGDGSGDRAFHEGLRAIAEATGGEFIETAPGINSLKSGMEALYDDLYQYRSWMIYFTYEAALHGGETEPAAIAIAQQGKTPLIADIPGRYPPPRRIETTVPDRKTPAPSSGQSRSQKEPYPSRPKGAPYRPLLGIIVSAFIIVLVLLAYFLHRHRNREKKALETKTHVSTDAPAARETIVEPPPRRMTLVGGFVYPPPGSKKPCALFVGTEGTIAGNRYSMEKEQFSVGQADGNDMVIPEDDQLSRHHAFFRYEKGSLFIHDRKSANGTYVNQKKLSDTGVALEPGDRIRFGGSTVEVAKP